MVWNAAAARLFGFTAEEAVGRPVRELQLAGVSEAEYETVRARFNSAAPETYESTRHTKDGTPVDLFVTTAPMFDENGTHVAKIISMTDISERRLAREKIRASEENLAITLHSIGDAVIVTDAAGLVTRMNPTAERLTGWPLVEGIGRSLSEVFHIVNAQTRARLDNPAQLVMARGEVVGLANHTLLLARDGHEYQIADSAAPIRDQAGKITGVVLVFSDVSEKYRADESLRLSEVALKSISQGVLITGADQLIVSANDAFAKITGYAVAETLGLNCRFLAGPDTDPLTVAMIRAALKNTTAFDGEILNYRKDGTPFWNELTITPIFDPQGVLTNFISITRDITVRKAAEAAHAALEAQLRESQKMQAVGTLAGGIAHDFNNIIATILGNAELAREDASANPPVLQSLDEIRKAGSRARDLVQQILSFSRRQPNEKKHLALAPIIEESVRLLRATLPARVALDAHCAADVPAVLADATQIEQVIINLATNAMQAMHGAPGRISLRLDTLALDAALADAHPGLRAVYAQHAGRVARLTVSDDGPGMEAAVRERIFEPFFTTKPVNEGTGLGLSVVHGIVQAHEGAITVESEPGKGTSFTLYLPVAESEDGGASEAPPVQPAQAGAEARIAAAATATGQRILYLDDDEALVSLMKRLLARQGYRVSGFVDQREALDALRADPNAFDLVITDYNMPGMSGLDVAREVRALRTDLPVAIASGFIDEALTTQAAEVGVRDLIFKATAVDEFCATVQRLAQTVA